MKFFVDNAEWQLPDRFAMTEDEFFEFATQMVENRIERDKHGNILILPPVGGNTGEYEVNVSFYI